MVSLSEEMRRLSDSKCVAKLSLQGRCFGLAGACDVVIGQVNYVIQTRSNRVVIESDALRFRLHSCFYHTTVSKATDRSVSFVALTLSLPHNVFSKRRAILSSSSELYAFVHAHVVPHSTLVLGLLDAPNGTSHHASGIFDGRVVAPVLRWDQLKHWQKDTRSAKYCQSFSQ